MNGLNLRLLASRPEGKVASHLKRKLCAHGKRHLKGRIDLVRYFEDDDERAQRWRYTREKMRYIIRQKCSKHFHCGYCYCPRCFGIYYVKGSPTMIIIQIKPIIYELRQFDEGARACLLEMLKNKDVKMLSFHNREEGELYPGPEVFELSLLRAIYLYHKYNYSQDVATSMELALCD